MEICEKAAEVLVARAIFNEEREMDARIWSLIAGCGGNLGGCADQCPESVPLGGKVGAGSSIDAHVIRQGDGIIA